MGLTRYLRWLRRENAKVPPDIHAKIKVALHSALAYKGIKAGDTLGDLVERHCPEIYATARELGCEITFDLPPNTHEALCAADFYYLLRSASRPN